MDRMLGRTVLLGAALALALPAASCAEPLVTFQSTTSQRPAAKPHAGHVKVFTLRPRRRFDEIGIIEVSGVEYQRAVYFARVRAAKQGCDGIVSAGGVTRPVGALGGSSYRFACVAWSVTTE